ncbi:MAG: hypothetical protein TQ37_07135 [Candidatus Synechococcus spongiarum 15L]|uniref:NADH:quinone oxidoreductase/Mrp antiporter membrane subunit domain-containing protein n=1 Tax=Candidatus Synechococcus spongiarum 15L TaxID=1608419 RepID=A0A0G8AUJ0_9SYNE|nr:MAG: hypothetical protein TQ37_07135 [Candidatus Synechococcus spongiarum 15L]
MQDVLLFFLAWELELIPVYLLLAMGFRGDGGPPGFAYGDIAAKPLGPAFQVLCYSGLLVAFGVKLPVVPPPHTRLSAECSEHHSQYRERTPQGSVIPISLFSLPLRTGLWKPDSFPVCQALTGGQAQEASPFRLFRSSLKNCKSLAPEGRICSFRLSSC